MFIYKDFLLLHRREVPFTFQIVSRLYIAVTQATCPHVYLHSLMHCHFVNYLTVSPDSNHLNSKGRIVAIYWILGYPQSLKMTAAFFILYWLFSLFLQVPGDTLTKAIGFSFSQSACRSEGRFCKSLVRLCCVNVSSRFSLLFFSLQSSFKMVPLAYVRVLACVEHLLNAHNTATKDEFYTRLFAART